MKLTRFVIAGVCMLMVQLTHAAESTCPQWLNQSMRLLHSEQSKNLCTAYGGKVLLLVNTASKCGFTPQFKGLEALNQRYKGQGLIVAGFSSDDFRQEAANEAQAAEVCFANYGVTFDMYAPISVKGASAHPLFKELARQGGGEPKWNFYKYLVNQRGEVVKRFSSMDGPDSEDLRKNIEQLLQAPTNP